MYHARIFIKNKLGLIFIVLIIYLMVPFLITMAATGKIEQNYSDELVDGRKVIVKYKNASQSMDINRFIVMVLAARLAQSQEVEVLKAESIMVRTDICRLMGEAMSIDSTSLGMEFLTENQMKNEWKEKYEENFNLLSDCVAATSGSVILCNNQYIEARYSRLSSGKTLSGAELLGQEYSYLVPVECSEDIKSPDYLCVQTFSYKDFVKKIESAYAQAGIHENAPFQDIQIVSKTDSGYVIKLQVGNVIMTGAEFARILEIPSACMIIENLQESIKITTKGIGDGFGVSIYTADIMAQQGSSYEEILKKFYSGITIVSQ